jgi:hypothetical protein
LRPVCGDAGREDITCAEIGAVPTVGYSWCREQIRPTTPRCLEVSQSNVSQLERGDDVRLSTLDSHIQALDEHLEIGVVFGEETVPIS